MFLMIVGSFTYITRYRINPVDSSVSPDGKYELLFQQVGDPDWPFGYTHARLMLKNESETIAKYPFDVANDGGAVQSDSWQVAWKDSYVEVVISGEEQNDEQYILYFDGKTEHNQLDMKRVSLNKGYTKNGFSEKVFHIHLRIKGDNEEIAFRDLLNSDPELAKQYEKLKIELWKEYEHDRDGYTNAKTEFVEKCRQMIKAL